MNETFLININHESYLTEKQLKKCEKNQKILNYLTSIKWLEQIQCQIKEKKYFCNLHLKEKMVEISKNENFISINVNCRICHTTFLITCQEKPKIGLYFELAVNVKVQTVTCKQVGQAKSQVSEIDANESESEVSDEEKDEHEKILF